MSESSTEPIDLPNSINLHLSPDPAIIAAVCSNLGLSPPGSTDDWVFSTLTLGQVKTLMAAAVSAHPLPAWDLDLKRTTHHTGWCEDQSWIRPVYYSESQWQNLTPSDKVLIRAGEFLLEYGGCDFFTQNRIANLLRVYLGHDPIPLEIEFPSGT